MFSVGTIMSLGRDGLFVRIVASESKKVQLVLVGYPGNYVYGYTGFDKLRKGDLILVFYNRGEYLYISKLAGVKSIDGVMSPNTEFKDTPYYHQGFFSRFIYKLLFLTKVGVVINALQRAIYWVTGSYKLKWDGGFFEYKGGDTPEIHLGYHHTLAEIPDPNGGDDRSSLSLDIAEGILEIYKVKDIEDPESSYIGLQIDAENNTKLFTTGSVDMKVGGSEEDPAVSVIFDAEANSLTIDCKGEVKLTAPNIKISGFTEIN